MQKAKLRNHDNKQTLDIPEEFRFKGDSVNITRMGKAVILYPEEEPWDILWDSLDKFTPDFMAEGREQPMVHEREDPFA